MIFSTVIIVDGVCREAEIDVETELSRGDFVGKKVEGLLPLLIGGIILFEAAGTICQLFFSLKFLSAKIKAEMKGN
jgi:hypothetical protein